MQLIVRYLIFALICFRLTCVHIRGFLIAITLYEEYSHGNDGASNPSQIPELSSAVFAKNLLSQNHYTLLEKL